MRTIRYIVLAVVALSSASLAGTDVLTLTLSALDSTVKSGSKIIVQVTTTNESNQTITYHNTRRDCDYSIKAFTATGELASETPYKKQLACEGGQLKSSGRNIVVNLKPGESDKERIEITALYEMSQPGEYKVQVERSFPEIGQILSNLVSIAVAPR